MAKPKTATRNQRHPASAVRKERLTPAQAAKIRATADRLMGK
jgi:hypothetical protein